MLSPKTRINISRIIPFGLIWLLFSLVYSLMERGLLGELTYYPATGIPYNFRETIFITAAVAFVSGLLVGTTEILYLHALFRRRSFITALVLKTALYCSIIISFLLLTTGIYISVELGKDITERQVWTYLWMFFTDYSFWGIEIYIASIIGVSLFYAEVSQNLGQGVLNNFFTGKYHSPVEEERIFMFLDMKSSTTIAETIGHVKYFEMLKEYFSDLTDPIMEHAGEIYQYVGDEIVVSWKVKAGLEHSNCIRCFFAIRSAIAKKGETYTEAFGLIPGFKAGFHVGKVTTGEIGVIKKDIIFTGDVLNTTARIQGLCNTYGVDLLVSDRLVRMLGSDSGLQFTSLGENELRGRDEKIELYTIRLS